MNICVVDDDLLVVQSLKTILSKDEIVNFKSSLEFVDALKSLSRSAPNIIFYDLCNAEDPEGEGSISRIPQVRRAFTNSTLIVLSSIQDHSRMRQCLEAGASWFVSKAQLIEEIPLIRARVEAEMAIRKTIETLILGESSATQQLRQSLMSLRLASGDVLVEGESGTGKELCAAAIAGDLPVTAINCAAIPSDLFESEFFGAEKGSFTGASTIRVGFFESTKNGILFLDEIQSLPLEMQAKLLRVLESRKFRRVGSTTEKTFEGRVVAASNRLLKELVELGKFREDLYYRLSHFSVHVPPLRARSRDVPVLANYFLDREAGDKIKFSEEAFEILKSYDWPGNIRELRNCVRQLSVESRMPWIDPQMVQTWLYKKSDLGTWDNEPVKSIETPSADATAGYLIDLNLGFDDNIVAFEKYLLTTVLSRHRGQEAREILKMARSRFYDKVKQHQIKQP
jgi:DNA-binding NtrC family response regulator